MITEIKNERSDSADKIISAVPTERNLMTGQINTSTCSNCANWEKQEELGDLDRKTHYFGVCKKGVGAVAQHPDEDGCVGDGRVEDGTGDGRTGANFGCIHFSKK